ncbi:MAG: hypothetical protein KDA99_29145, partial [Planctomycetales bacterium]|nr:hypothetical protein [Planctomycetales bacterium]
RRYDLAKWSLRIAATLAVAMLARYAAFDLRTSYAVDRIANAIQGKPCIKRTRLEGDKPVESWNMLDLDATARVDSERITYRNAQQGTVDTFHRKSGMLVRFPSSQPGSPLSVDLVQMFVELAKGKAISKRPGMEITESKLLSDASGSRLVIEAVDRQRATKIQAEVSLLNESGLPQSSKVVIRRGNETRTFQEKWEYPDHSPASIYELGVDRSINLCDSVPSAEIKQVASQISDAIDRFDSYRAVVVTTSHPDVFHYGPGDVSLVGKRDNSVLVKQNANSLLPPLQGKPPEEVATLIMDNPQLVSWRPLSLANGRKKTTFEGQSDGNAYRIRAANTFEADIIPYRNVTPHVVARTIADIGARGHVCELVGDVHGNSQLELCIRNLLPIVEGRGEFLATTIMETRKRVDPTRGHLVIHESQTLWDGTADTFEIIKAVQTPSKIWFPTHAIRTVERGDSIKTHYYYRLDFEHLLPLEEFNPQHYVVDTK